MNCLENVCTLKPIFPRRTKHKLFSFLIVVNNFLQFNFFYVLSSIFFHGAIFYNVALSKSWAGKAFFSEEPLTDIILSDGSMCFKLMLWLFLRQLCKLLQLFLLLLFYFPYQCQTCFCAAGVQTHNQEFSPSKIWLPLPQDPMISIILILANVFVAQKTVAMKT